MVDWVAGLADASVAERDSGTVLVRVPGSPDVLKEAAVSGFVTKDANGNAGVGTSSPSTRLDVAQNAGGYWTGSSWTATPSAITVTNTLAGGYDPVFIGRMTDSGGTSKNAFAIGAAGTGAWTAGNDASQIADMYIASRNGSGGITERVRITSSGHILAGVDNTQTLGSASKRWSVVFAGTSAINTSDKDEKTDIGDIPDAWLDAWADARWVRFKMIDGVRWHVGLVAQQVHAAFAAHEVDAFEIGLCCYDAWEEEREPIFETVTRTRNTSHTEYVAAGVNEQGQTLFTAHEVEGSEEYQESIDTGETTVTKPAGDLWGLRYDECEAIEAAYQRREMGRMAARLAALENQV